MRKPLARLILMACLVAATGCERLPHASIYWGGFELGATGHTRLSLDPEASKRPKVLTISYAGAPVDSFVRVTNRDTSRALIARVVAPQEDAAGSGLSAAAARRLGMGERSTGAAYVEEIVAQVGPASWYGKAFHGRPTASGERYDQNAMTAAHRFLPFGTRVRITNEKTGTTVAVRINDRGSFIKGRIVDVSKAVAERLGFRQQGIAIVRLEVIREP